MYLILPKTIVISLGKKTIVISCGNDRTISDFTVWFLLQSPQHSPSARFQVGPTCQVRFLPLRPPGPYPFLFQWRRRRRLVRGCGGTKLWHSIDNGDNSSVTRATRCRALRDVAPSNAELAAVHGQWRKWCGTDSVAAITRYVRSPQLLFGVALSLESLECCPRGAGAAI